MSSVILNESEWNINVRLKDFCSFKMFFLKSRETLCRYWRWLFSIHLKEDLLFNWKSDMSDSFNSNSRWERDIKTSTMSALFFRLPFIQKTSKENVIDNSNIIIVILYSIGITFEEIGKSERQKCAVSRKMGYYADLWCNLRQIYWTENKRTKQ